MPDFFKVTLVMEGRSRGWTESYHYLGATGLHKDIELPTQKLCKARANLLGAECRIKGFRISSDSVAPDALLSYEEFVPTSASVLGQTASVTSPAAMPDVALLMRCSDPTMSHHKNIFVRGVPDRIENQHGKYTPDSAWNLALKRFKTILTDENWGWWGVVNKVAKVKVSSVTSDPAGRVTFTFLSNLFPAEVVGTVQKVRVSGVNKKSTANGQHIVFVQDRTTCKTETPLAVGPYYFGGVGSFITMSSFIKIADVREERIVERKAGAPLLESPGRQKARPRA